MNDKFEVEMVMVQQLAHAYVPKDYDIVLIPRRQLARMSKPIIVECPVGHKLFQEEMTGYREADTGCVMVMYQQFNKKFS